MGRSHFSFGGERKVCKRKPAARRLREKALYCPFWRRGSLCRAQRSWPATPAIVRARSSPFSAVKMGGPFSLRCLSPLCSGAVGGGQAYPLRGFCFRHSGCGAVLPLAGEKGFCGLAVLPRKEQSLLLPRSWRGATLPLAGEWDSVAWPISGGHRPAGLRVRAMRPVAEWRSESATRQGAAPDPRAARPVAERR